jgi:hypothetical protein
VLYPHARSGDCHKRGRMVNGVAAFVAVPQLNLRYSAARARER